MNLLEDGFDADFCIDNEDGVRFGDIFYLNYYGINVFFYVCGLDRHRVRIFELAKKRGRINGESSEFLTPKLNPTTSPYFVQKNNCWTKSEYWAETESEGRIKIPITYSSRIFYKALELGVEYPVVGDAYAINLKEEQKVGICKYYWVAPKKKPKQKINKIKISA